MALLVVAVGPVVTKVTLICNDELIKVLCLPDCDCDGPATGEGVGTAASEEPEYVKVCGVYTHVEAAGHGSNGDVHYTIVLVLGGA